MRLTDRFYAYFWQGYGNNCNSYIYRGKQLVLIDPGHIVNESGERCLETLTRSISADGIKLEEIGVILCTHGHPDHVEAVGVIRERSGAKVGIHRQDAFFLEALEQRARAAGMEKMPPLAPDFYLQAGELNLGPPEAGGDLVRVIQTPGHSPGSICFYFPREKALVTGDTVFEGSIGRSDLPGGNFEELGRSVAALAQLDEVELLLPGHMGPVRGTESIRRNFDLIQRMFFGH
ncbi:MAG TPA: MBL fold metallo-hydrolase [Bacillota bacterium]|jgi:glyoxylase-like metal-dependent hydrolase (beta-lactamase superfamily II)|nr:MBL fold metallo-hydrolase [Bacillota bacterium]NMD32635.1 MBL fold metallo-hydrolase [Bacillota bacterium]HOB28259.1 MBL fold metallo-hydrolase [Bacillota bacterium]HQD51825.1 MBL fold metallo-hydrolase [Bacillota bacterium]